MMKPFLVVASVICAFSTLGAASETQDILQRLKADISQTMAQVAIIEHSYGRKLTDIPITLSNVGKSEWQTGIIAEVTAEHSLTIVGITPQSVADNAGLGHGVKVIAVNNQQVTAANVKTMHHTLTQILSTSSITVKTLDEKTNTAYSTTLREPYGNTRYTLTGNAITPTSEIKPLSAFSNIRVKQPNASEKEGSKP